jgi:hypothetical protein
MILNKILQILFILHHQIVAMYMEHVILHVQVDILVMLIILIIVYFVIKIANNVLILLLLVLTVIILGISTIASVPTLVLMAHFQIHLH